MIQNIRIIWQERRNLCMEEIKESIRKDMRHAVDGKRIFIG